MNKYDTIKENLRTNPKIWLVTGVAGFIGSNLLESLLTLDQTVVGMDNFATGSQKNIDEVYTVVSEEQWRRFRFVTADIRSLDDCKSVCADVDYVLHQAALGSVPRSIDNPVATNENNITGTLNMMVAARDARVERFVYASSSAVYGGHPALPKLEENIGNQLSPYAVTKYVSELYARQFACHYGLNSIGLRYFNVFGKRQDPEGAYAAVIPKWISAMIKGEQVIINGTGETSRDFCFVDNVVQMNILSAVTNNPVAVNQIYNVALNERTDLNQLFEMLRSRLLIDFPHLSSFKPEYRDFRPGDVMHSQADIGKAEHLLGYEPTHSIEHGLDNALDWYTKNLV